MDKIPWDVMIAIFASSGFWAFITAVYTSRGKKKSAETRLLLGLSYREIVSQCHNHLEKGYLTINEWEDLNKYFYKPYMELGGDGTVERLWKEVEELPVIHE